MVCFNYYFVFFKPLKLFWIDGLLIPIFKNTIEPLLSGFQFDYLHLNAKLRFFQSDV